MSVCGHFLGHPAGPERMSALSGKATTKLPALRILPARDALARVSRSGGGTGRIADWQALEPNAAPAKSDCAQSARPGD